LTTLRERLAAKSWYRWYAIGVIALVYASNQLDRQIMAVVLEPVRLELGASDTEMGFLIGLTFAIFYATLGMPIAMLADRYNRRNIITSAIVVWSGFTVLCGYATTFTQLALARIGVGVGEAGSTPPSHSLISDLFPAGSRATAMGLFAVGANVGLLLAYMVGGWLVQHHGWRFTFIAVGVPGLLVAALVYFTTVEPKRGHSETPSAQAAQARENAPGFRTVVSYLWRTRSCRYVVLGASCASFIGYGSALWMPTFLIRSHELSSSQAGFVLALMTGVIGGFGTFAAGRITDILSASDIRWRCWVVTLASVAMVPFLLGMYYVDSLTLALLLYLVPAFMNGCYVAPTYSMIQELVSVRARAVASAILLFVMNMIGMGCGPQLVGILSDFFARDFGSESLRMAMMLLSCVNLLCAGFYFLASRSLRGDFSAANLRAA